MNRTVLRLLAVLMNWLGEGGREAATKALRELTVEDLIKK